MGARRPSRLSARDNLRSTRSREDIDFDAEVRTKVQVLKARMLDAFGGDKYADVVAELARIALDPRTPQKTRVVALTAYARAAGSLVAEAPTVNVAGGVSISPADLLRLIPSDTLPPTTGCGVPLSDTSTPISLPTSVLQEDLRLDRPEVVPGLSPLPPEDGQTTGVRSDSVQSPPPTPLTRAVPTDGLPDTASSDAKDGE